MLCTRVALLAVACASLLIAANGAPSITADGLVNSASGQNVFAPYTICTLYGTNLFLNGVATSSNSIQAPDSLGGMTVLIGPFAAGIFYMSATQMNVLVPNTLTPGTYPLTVVRQGMASQTVSITIQEVAPGIFAVTHADGSRVSASSPASPVEVVVIYATGLGRMKPDPQDLYSAPAAAPIVHMGDLQVLLDGMPIDPTLVLYAGATPNSPGLYQVNVRLPDGLSTNNPELKIIVAGISSQPGFQLLTASPNP